MFQNAEKNFQIQENLNMISHGLTPQQQPTKNGISTLGRLSTRGGILIKMFRNPENAHFARTTFTKLVASETELG